MANMIQLNEFPWDLPLPYQSQLQCYSVAMFPNKEREDVEKGGKIILPPSALDVLTQLNISYPMLFKITNCKVKRFTHCGVLEFIADEGKAYLPYWMMRYLLVDEGDRIDVEFVSLPTATYSKFQPQSPDFLDITNPKAVLENCLRNFACLTTGEVIAIHYNQRVYELNVLETKPGAAVGIIECDMNVDFIPPVGYQDPVTKTEQKEEQEMIDPTTFMDHHPGFFAFKGKGNRLDGKQKKRELEPNSPPLKRPYQRGIPDYDYQVGEINFLRNVRPYPLNNKENRLDEEFTAFSGEGHILKKRKEK